MCRRRRWWSKSARPTSPPETDQPRKEKAGPRAGFRYRRRPGSRRGPQSPGLSLVSVEVRESCGQHDCGTGSGQLAREPPFCCVSLFHPSPVDPARRLTPATVKVGSGASCEPRGVDAEGLLRVGLRHRGQASLMTVVSEIGAVEDRRREPRNRVDFCRSRSVRFSLPFRRFRTLALNEAAMT
jgi:hypothetical protein